MTRMDAAERGSRAPSRSRIDTVVAVLRDGAWLTRDRVRGYLRLLLATTVVLALGWTAMSHAGIDRTGKPLGTDFSGFWTASRMARTNPATLVYDLAAHARAERAGFGGADAGDYPFFYPPMFLLMCLPLALAPYLASLATWLLVTGAACWRAIRSVLGEAGRGLGGLMLAFPAVFVNAGHGQNGFLTTALLAFWGLSLDAAPLRAGVLLGLLAFKPQLGLLAPVMLLASGRWTTFAAAAATVAVLVAVTTLAFGPPIWPAFLATLPPARFALEQGLTGWEKMPSVFASARLLGANIVLAYGLQGLAALIAAGIVFGASRHARRSGRGLAQAAVLTCAAPLATPYLLDYDLMVLALPIAWVVREARTGGFLPWEKSVLFAAFLLPLVLRPVAGALHAPFGPPVAAALLWIVVRRARSLPESAGDPGRARPVAGAFHHGGNQD